MKPYFIIKLAFRDLKGNKLRSSLTIGGVALGIGFIVFLLSLGFGLERLITSQITDIEALKILDVVSGKSKIVKIDDSTEGKFQELGIIEETAASINVAGKLEYKTSTTDGIVYGKDLNYLSLENPRLYLGDRYSSNEEKEALVNITALKQLGIKDYKKAIGETIKLTLTPPEELLGNVEEKTGAKSDEFVIVGVVDNESSPFAYIPLTAAKKFGIKNYTNLKAKVKNKEKIDLAKKQIENFGYKVTSLKDTVSQINQFFIFFKFILVGFGLIAMVIAILGMFNTLTISLLEKTREIGLMKLLGTTNRDIYKLFLAQALSIGIIGGIVGILFGYSGGALINFLIYGLARKTGNEAITIFYTPLNIILIMFGSSIIVSLITGLYPSMRASKISALNALRYE